MWQHRIAATWFTGGQPLCGRRFATGIYLFSLIVSLTIAFIPVEDGRGAYAQASVSIAAAIRRSASIHSGSIVTEPKTAFKWYFVGKKWRFN